MDIKMIIFLYGIWIILNGRITLEICLIGLPVCCAVFLFATKFLKYSVEKELHFYRMIPWGIHYLLNLLWEIFLANLQVLKLVLFHPHQIHPVRIWIDSPVRTRIGRVLLANSITLTPGTITVECQDDRFLIHCLSEEFSEGLDTSSFVKLLQKLESTKENKESV